jgi:hypothetical protein
VILLYGRRSIVAGDDILLANPGSDSFSETTTTSWLSRIGESIKGVLAGLALVVGSVFLLFWNEGRAVQTERSLAEGASLVVDVGTDRVVPANEAKLVHATGDAKTTVPLSDREFGVVANGLRLVRTVEMYQWKEESKTETHKNLGGSESATTTYSYLQVWSDSRIDSSRFKHAEGHTNPQMRYQSHDVVASDATLGSFQLRERVLRLLPADEELRVDPALADALRQRLGGAVQVVDGKFYVGTDLSQPRTGDLKIGYRLAKLGPISVIGRQSGSELAAYQTTAGDQLLMATPGQVPASVMFKQARDKNRMFTWILRLVGAVIMLFGWALVFRPLVVVADVVPLLGSVLGAGAGLAALLLTAASGTFVIAVAWFWYRPLVSIFALLAGAAVVLGVRMLASRKPVAQAVPAGA